MELKVLRRGSCEPLKAGIHATALGLFALMGLYNSAAWLTRHHPHLAVNAMLYSALTLWERRHVAHHVRELRRCQAAKASLEDRSPPTAPVTVLAA
jgi:hypothetical protein